MALANNRKNIEKLYSLIDSGKKENFSKALKFRSAFKHLVKDKWEASSDDSKQKIIRFAGRLNVEEGLDVILKGFKCHVLNVRLSSKAVLEELSNSITVPYNIEGKISEDTVRQSVIFSSALFEEMKKTIALEETKLFMRLLLSIGTRGPSYAWRYFTLGIAPDHILVDMVKGYPEPLRLVFALQYAESHIAHKIQFGDSIRNVLHGIKDRKTVITFFTYLFDRSIPFGSIFREMGDRLDICTDIIIKDLKAKGLSDRINGIKILGLFREPRGYQACIPLLYANEKISIRIACLKMFSKSDVSEYPGLLQILYSLLEDSDQRLVYHAYKTLVKFNAAGLEKVTNKILVKFPSIREMLYECIGDLELVKMTAVLNSLAEEFSKEARRAFLHSVIKKDHDKMIKFFKQYEFLSDDKSKQNIISLRKKIEAVRLTAIKDLSKYTLPKKSQEEPSKKSFFGRFANGKNKKNIKQLQANCYLENIVFDHENLCDLDLTGARLTNVSFENACLSDIKFSSAQFKDVSFKGAFLKNVKMDNVQLNSVSFENTVLNNVVSDKASYAKCSFKMARIYGCSFKFSHMPGVDFVGAYIRKTNFSQADLSESSFVVSDMGIVSFNHALFYCSDFYGSSLKFCEFKGTEFSTSSLLKNTDANPEIDILSIPEDFLNSENLKAHWFDLLVISEEIERQRSLFLTYNDKRIDLAMDTFKTNQRVLFEMIPLLIHSNDICLRHPYFLKKRVSNDIPCGIKRYIPSQRVINLVKKEFDMDVPNSKSSVNPLIDGLYTIGSVGSIAQTEDSDIDYWVCINESQIEENSMVALQKKLQAIEEWAQEKFDTEIHFFIVDPEKVREGRFGGSDQESSGSAQGKILKEEFYRTMILVAGKIPFWCVFPSWMDNKYYQFSSKMVSRMDDMYLDLGNVFKIPKGEYFGASIWQLFKSLKSPFKSVMKMALLEKYIQEEKTNTLLCNQLKSRWISTYSDYSYIDPYLLLFERVLEFYRKENNKDAKSLIQQCFFLKVGIETSIDVKTFFGYRKKMIEDCMNRWDIKSALIEDLRTFGEWPYQRRFQFGVGIKDYMLGTYKRLATFLKTTAAGETLITTRDLTILGRKMFAHFAVYPNKVETLPFVFPGTALFEQVRLQYARKGNKTSWELFNQKKNSDQEGTRIEVIKKMERIEEIAIWIVHNGLYLSVKSIKLMPNPTEVLPQDFIDLLAKLQAFFITTNNDVSTPEFLQEKSRVSRLFIIANYCLNRKLDRIHEFAVIYLTTWGEMYCKMFYSDKGFISLEKAYDFVEDKLGVPVHSAKIGGFVPQQVRKRIKAGRGIDT